MTRIVLPWPSPALSSNARVHWSARARATQRARWEAMVLARSERVTPDPNAVLSITYHPPSINRRRDVQNMPAMLKPAIDGIADAMGCDDSGFRPRFPDHFAAPVKGGAVIIEIAPPGA